MNSSNIYFYSFQLCVFTVSNSISVRTIKKGDVGDVAERSYTSDDSERCWSDCTTHSSHESYFVFFFFFSFFPQFNQTRNNPISSSISTALFLGGCENIKSSSHTQTNIKYIRTNQSKNVFFWFAGVFCAAFLPSNRRTSRSKHINLFCFVFVFFLFLSRAEY